MSENSVELSGIQWSSVGHLIEIHKSPGLQREFLIDLGFSSCKSSVLGKLWDLRRSEKKAFAQTDNLDEGLLGCHLDLAACLAGEAPGAHHAS